MKISPLFTHPQASQVLSDECNRNAGVIMAVNGGRDFEAQKSMPIYIYAFTRRVYPK